MVKYADDTYLVIPACNVQSRAAELDNVEVWAENNNLRLNHCKSVHRRPLSLPMSCYTAATPARSYTSDDIEDIGRHNQQLALRHTACQ